LAFSVLLLNTDAHNPSVKKKMTLAQFIRNNASNFFLKKKFFLLKFNYLLNQ